MFLAAIGLVALVLGQVAHLYAMPDVSLVLYRLAIALLTVFLAMYCAELLANAVKRYRASLRRRAYAAQSARQRTAPPNLNKHASARAPQASV